MYLLAHGRNYTLINKPEQQYPLIDIKQIVELVKRPDMQEKPDADFIIPSSNNNHRGREHAFQREHGQFCMLTGDIDSGNLEKDFIVSVIQRVLGDVAFLVYSSASATPDNKKWRVLVPIKTPVSGDMFSYYQQAFYSLAPEITFDTALTRTGQPVFLPNVPPGQRDDEGAPLFYEYHIHSAPLLYATAVLGPEAKRLHDIDEEIRQHRAAPSRQDDGDSPSARFNREHTVEDMLIKYGYEHHKGDQWRSPYQQTGSYATKNMGDYWVSLSGSDAEAGLGQESAYGARFGDAFDLFVHFEHGGDMALASRAMIGADSLESSPFESVTAITDQGFEIQQFDWDQWGFTTANNKFMNVFTGQKFGVEAFKLAFTQFVPVTNRNGNPIEAPKYFLRHQLDKIADREIYWPMAGADRFFVYNDVRYVNSYKPFAAPNTPEDWRSNDAWKVVFEHIKNIIPHDYNQLLDWMAHNVQYPGEKILWAPIIKGVQGDGKTTLYRVMAAAMGAPNVKEISPQELGSEFSGWAEGACLAVLEEIRLSGHNRFEVMDKLKPMITNETISIVKKGMDGMNVPNTQNYMALTNHDDALPLDLHDRRWGVFFTRFESRDAMLNELGDDYWEDLHHAYRDHAGVIRAWLLSRNLANFNKNRGPEVTAAKMRMIDAARTDSFNAVKEAIELGGFGVHRVVLSSSHLTRAMKEHELGSYRGKALHNALVELGFVNLEWKVKWRGSSHRVWVKTEAIDRIFPNRSVQYLFNSNNSKEINITLRAWLDKTVDFDDDNVTPFDRS